MSRTDGGRAFILVIIVSAFAAGALYLVQVKWVDPWLSSRWGSAIFRMLRMILVYVVPAVWWLRRYRSNELVTKLKLDDEKTLGINKNMTKGLATPPVK